MPPRLLLLITIAVVMLLVHPSFVFSESDGNEFLDIPITELTNVVVTSPSKREGLLMNSSTAIFVLTGEEIRQAGITNLPEALRLVPGMQVARAGSGDWAISARGFNDIFATKLLVLIDGRSVYTPDFSGVYWAIPDVIFADLDRIEVIRGPGASLWGANAVNGVINIITKNTEKTQGTHVTISGGSEDHAIGAVRYGGKISESSNYRAYAKGTYHDELAIMDGGGAQDSWQAFSSGFRTDSYISKDDSINIQGDVRDVQKKVIDRELLLTEPFQNLNVVNDDLFNANFLSNWEHTFEDGSNSSLQFYYDYTERATSTNSINRHTFDLNWQHHLKWSEGADFTWGAELNVYNDLLEEGTRIRTSPRSDTWYTPSAFFQQEYMLFDKAVHLTLGSKFQHNTFSGFEVQPTIRGLYAPNSSNSFWAAISRAVRTPNRFQDGVEIQVGAFPLDDGGVGVATINGTGKMQSEEVLAYEVGYRTKSIEGLTLDLATFYNKYNRLASLSSSAPVESEVPGVALEFPSTIDNEGDAYSYGGELVLTNKPFPWWELIATYSYININSHFPDGSIDSSGTDLEKNTAHNLANLRSRFELSEKTSVTAFLWYVDNLPAFNVGSYTELNLQLGYKISNEFRFDLIGQNLLHDVHGEYVSNFTNGLPIQIERSVLGRFTFDF